MTDPSALPSSAAVANLALCAAGGFFLLGLLCGAWKYIAISRSPEARSHLYVDLAHRASLLYAFACFLLGELIRRSVWSPALNRGALVILVVFFAITVLAYVVHGLLRDTDNQFARPHRLGPLRLPAAAMVTFMVLLVVGEVGSFLVLFGGFLAGL